VASGQPVGTSGGAARELEDEELHAVLDRVPCVAGRPRTITRVPGGLTNTVVRVEAGGGPAVARISGPGTALLAIDRDAEHADSRTAARAGVAPEVICRSAEAGVLVVRWVEGRTLSAADVRDLDTLGRIAGLCRTLHAGGRFTADFDMFAVQQRYLRIVAEQGFRLPAGYADLAEPFARMRRVLALRAGRTVPCHNDLLAENLIDDGERLWMVDFEYAGNNDPCFELGNLASESALSVEQLEHLVRAYFGGYSAERVARARLHALAAKYSWTLWASISEGAGPPGVDFWAWGMEKYERAVEEFASPDFERLLKEVAGA
jgi:thiamine kinase-like enzyme